VIPPWLFFIACIYAGAVAAALYRAVRQFRRYESLDAVPVPTTDPPSLAVIVPARNEADSIENCLAGLLGQQYPHDQLDVFAFDDNSSDETSTMIQRLAAEDDRLHLIETTEPPAGWTGKARACWLGAVAASDTNREWLCFVDADTRAVPSLLSTALDAAHRRNLDMISLEPFQELSSFLDRMVIPVGLLAIAATQDLRRVNRADSDRAAVNGQFILVRTACYFDVGGHAAVRAQICEDDAFARQLKAKGFSLAVFGAERLIRTRMYRDARSVWLGLSKNVTEMYGGGARTLLIAAAGLTVGWSSVVVPVTTAYVAAHHPSPVAIIALIVSLVTTAAVYATQLALARKFRLSYWFAVLFPLSCSLGTAIAVNAAIWRGRGRVAWKGRYYASSENAAARHGPWN
jgi:chlorobactene glucosyltransferase